MGNPDWLSTEYFPSRPVMTEPLSMDRTLTIEYDEFAWSRINDEAARQGTSAEEIVRHATAYYLSDLASGRLTTRVLPEIESKPDPRSDGG